MNKLARLAALSLAAALAGGCVMEGEGEEPVEGDDIAVDQESLLYGIMGSSGQNGFNATVRTHDWFCVGTETCDLGDFNGDGRKDLITFVPGPADVYVAISSASGLSYTSSGLWHLTFARSNHDFAVGDVNHDGRDDVVSFDKIGGQVRVALSTGAGFGAESIGLTGFCTGAQTCKVADVNGDGTADAVRFLKSTSAALAGDVYVALGTGTGTFSAPTLWHDYFCVGNEICDLGDFNMDERADAITFLQNPGVSGGTYIARSTGTSFTDVVHPHTDLCSVGYSCTSGDVDGDDRDDLVIFSNGTGLIDSGYDWTTDVNVSLSHQIIFTLPWLHFTAPYIRHDNFCPSGHVCRVGDVNGDGKEDLVAFARSSLAGAGAGDVFVSLSNFGKPTTWQIDLNRIKARVTEGTGDKPLIMTLSFRSTIDTPGSTVITRNVFNESFATGIVAGGPWITIPSNVGQANFSGVRLLTPSQMFTLAANLELFGTIAIVIEKDLTAADSYNGLMNEATTALRVALEVAIEDSSMIDLLNPTFLEDKMSEIETAVRDAVSFSIIDDLLWWFLSGIFDPDDFIDYHIWIYPGLDKAAQTMLAAPSDPAHVSLGIPGEMTWEPGLSSGFGATVVPINDSDSPLAYDMCSASSARSSPSPRSHLNPSSARGRDRRRPGARARRPAAAAGRSR
jgi:hypothetical protein